MVTVSVLLLLLSVVSPPVHSSITTFHVIPVLMTQSEARAACRENYTDLVTVYSDEDNTDLVNLLSTAHINHGWIGLYRSQVSEKWSNGVPVKLSNLAGDCGTSSCCAVMTPDGSWESLECNMTRYFMCYEQGDNKDRNYHLIRENETWYGAQRYCRRNYTDLVTIRDQQQYEEVKIKGLNSSTSFWISLLRDDWQWTDGGTSAYRNWEGGQPRPSPNDCVRLIGGRWCSTPCSNNDQPLCYDSSIHVSAEALSWQEALDYCNEGNRAGILNIDSEAEQEEVESELRRRRVPPGSPLWVGLRQSRLFGFWIWTDGTVVSPTANWDGGKPPEGPLSQHCGAVVPPDYRWRDMNCRAQYRAVCHIKCSP